MDKIVSKLIPCLEREKISYKHHGSRVRIPLPCNFGELEVADLGQSDTILELVDGDWHSHADVLRYYGGDTPEEAIVCFLKRLFAGDFYLVELRKDGKTTRKYIHEDRDKESILRYLEPGEEAVIFNDT